MKTLLVSLTVMIALTGCLQQGAPDANARAAADVNDNGAEPTVSFAREAGLIGGDELVEFECRKDRESDGKHFEYQFRYEPVYHAELDEVVNEVTAGCGNYYGGNYKHVSTTRAEGADGYEEARCQMTDDAQVLWTFEIGDRVVIATDGTNTLTFEESDCE